MDVIGYGDADVDIFLNVERIPERDEKILANDFSFHKGGMVTNTLVSLSRLGRDVGYHGRIGDDPFGQLALENLKKNNIDTGGVILRRGGQTFFCVILVDSSGEKALISAPTDCRIRDPKDIDAAVITNARHLHTTAAFLEAAQRVVKIAKENRMTVSVDMDSGSAGSKGDLFQLIPYTDILFLNERGAQKLGGSNSMEEIAKKLVHMSQGIVCITRGDRGSITATPEMVFHTNAFNVDIVDTTGAGDNFAAGFIHGYLANWPLDYIAIFANAVAAINSMKIGGHTGAPTAQEVSSFLQNKGIQPIE